MSLGEITCEEGAATVNCFCLEQSAAVTSYFAWKNGDLSVNTCQAVAKSVANSWTIFKVKVALFEMYWL